MLKGDGEMEALRILSWQLSLMIEEQRKKKNITQQLFTLAAVDPELHTLKVFLTSLPYFPFFNAYF